MSYLDDNIEGNMLEDYMNQKNNKSIEDAFEDFMMKDLPEMDLKELNKCSDLIIKKKIKPNQDGIN